MPNDGETKETYFWQEIYKNHAPTAQPLFVQRTAQRNAGFFLPHLNPGLRLLDCGCGPGSITLDLAEIVAPGEVIGIDNSPVAIERATAAAAERGVSNARFEVGSIFELPFAPNSFDVVFSHNVMEHLSNPVAALVEMYRVLKPGGVAGVRSPDFDGRLIAPVDPLILQTFDLWRRLIISNNGDPGVGKKLLALFHQAGFVRVQASASYECDSAQSWGERMTAQLSGGAMAAKAIELGLTNSATLHALSAAWQAWASEPDAFHANASGEAIGWKE